MTTKRTPPAQRQMNFELLRIFSILIIIFNHFSIHGGFAFDTSSITWNRLWIQFILGGNLGVDLFVLISGYFLITWDRVDTRKAVRLWTQMFFYSVVIFLVFLLTGRKPFQVRDLVSALLPVLSGQWWFASTYLILYLIFPFVNILLRSMSREEYRRMLLGMAFLWCGIPTFCRFSVQANHLIVFICLYSVGGYIRLWREDAAADTGKCVCVTALLSGLYLLIVLSFNVIGLFIPIFGQHPTFFNTKQGIPIVALAVSIFLVFKSMRVRQRKWIQVLSSATFGVYLIHDHPWVREFLWTDLFRNAVFQDSPRLIPYSCLVVFAVYSCCTVLERLRAEKLERAYLPAVNRAAAWIDRSADWICSFAEKIGL